MTVKQRFIICVLSIFCALSVVNCGIFAPRNAKTPSNSTRYNRQTVSNVVQKARSYAGSPYKYGGTTSAGFDCSGLVTVAFQSVNLALPRTSYDMASVGEEIKTADIKVGDLVFFVTSKTGDRINHVGIVTEVQKNGEIRFIHASDSGVREDNLGSKYYKSTFVKATRPF
jgi:probable lipoprotein NlpC